MNQYYQKGLTYNSVKYIIRGANGKDTFIISKFVDISLFEARIEFVYLVVIFIILGSLYEYLDLRILNCKRFR